MRTDYSRQLPPEWKAISLIFTALGHEQRQRIVMMFERGEQLNLGQIVEASTLSRTAVSHHLRSLHEAGILSKRKAGKEVYYALDVEVLERCLGNVLDYIHKNYK